MKKRKQESFPEDSEIESSASKKVKKNQLNANASSSAASTPKRAGNKSNSSFNHSFENNSFDYEGIVPRRSQPAVELLKRSAIVPEIAHQECDVTHISETLKQKKITASKLKFGFIGLGIMGCGIVKNLLNSNHKVYVWNRTEAKSRKFEQIGAEIALTPVDVIDNSDITFSCVSDPAVCKDVSNSYNSVFPSKILMHMFWFQLIFGNCGIASAQNLLGKGYVEMTSIDTDTSKDISEALTMRGARYLEAQIQGSKEQAEEGTLIILAAGDRNLFEECQTCFEAMGKNSFFLGDVGNASKMNLVLQTLAGITMAGLSEALALGESAFFEIWEFSTILILSFYRRSRWIAAERHNGSFGTDSDGFTSNSWEGIK